MIHAIHMPPCSADVALTEHGEDDHLVQEAAVLEAAAHVAGCHDVGIDHAGQLFERGRLAHHREHASPPPVHAVQRGGLATWVDGSQPSTEHCLPTRWALAKKNSKCDAASHGAHVTSGRRA